MLGPIAVIHLWGGLRIFFIPTDITIVSCGCGYVWEMENKVGICKVCGIVYVKRKVIDIYEANGFSPTSGGATS